MDTIYFYEIRLQHHTHNIPISYNELRYNNKYIKHFNNAKMFRNHATYTEIKYITGHTDCTTKTYLKIVRPIIIELHVTECYDT